MKTAAVKKLVSAALDNIPEPRSEDVIEDVFMQIENELELRTEYDELVKQLGKTTVNAWGGYWIANALGKTGPQQVTSKRCKLIQSFSRLTTTAPTAAGAKRKEPEALQLMSDYYQAHKARLSPSVRNHRALIIEMIVEGLPVDQVFASVPLEPAEPQGSALRRR
jgi:hypothetical protein